MEVAILAIGRSTLTRKCEETHVHELGLVSYNERDRSAGCGFVSRDDAFRHRSLCDGRLQTSHLTADHEKNFDSTLHPQ